ncbi:hypothetical protein DXG01_003377 [Tephrocybe rancida]|nr:hypothetical protein DXG01_003377 [Tephrocybe rancida]
MGWWGYYSDRHGRTRLLSISVIGLLYTDFNFIFTTRNFQRLPGGYWFILLGPIVEGSLGGLMASIAAMHAYVADTTTESARSRTLSLCLGLLFAGMAIGPTLGGLLVRFSGSPLSVFYAALGVHVVYALMVYLVLPESLLKSQMEKSREKYAAELRETSQSSAAGVLGQVKRLFAFLSPLSVFLPELKEQVPGENPLKRRKRDWTLTLVAGVYALAVSIVGSYTTKFQYAAATFGWSSETLGYFLTLVGASRAVFLTVILPCFIKFFKPRPVPPPRNSETEPLLPPSPVTTARLAHPSTFDLSIARVSLFIEVISYTLMALAPTALVYTGFSVVASMGAGLTPALQSVALALYRRRGGTESGRLFGALSVIQAMSSQIIGPAMYSLVYMKTVATFPRAIFILSTVTCMSSFGLLAFVRLPRRDHKPATDDIEEEVTTISAR